ncbi:GGDEF domain-containing protein [Liquorilactobacillus mali]|uniref:GGDEF domain-containing protein n=1 Tax=Liquorilactobacillus mali TaxID=1618 RepID=UPI0023504F7D|nr:GGDEF domain-containing protein [Liquorilactobacillus mali]MDC7953530.1 GGDEF domain-containing protein [Liquorilactobacillus mali]
MLEMFILGIMAPIITICFLFCKYYFFRIYVVSLEHKLWAYIIFYFFLSTFYFVIGSFNYFYLEIVCFQYVVGITAFFLDGRIRGYIAFALMPPVLTVVELVNGVYSAATIRYIFLIMLGSIAFCELINFLTDIDLFSKYAASLVVINIASPVLIGAQWKNVPQTYEYVYIPILIGSIIIVSFVYGYSAALQRKEVQILELRYEATYDGLTDLQNYDSFSNYVTENDTEKPQVHVVVMLDIDNFKQINDTFGHLEGNNVIKFFAASLKIFFNKNCPKNVEIYRFGGEEFCILFKDQNIGDCFDLMLRFQEELSSKDFLTDKRQSVNITFSGGIAEANEFDEIDKAVKAADMALYLAKKTGRAKIVCPDCEI